MNDATLIALKKMIDKQAKGVDLSVGSHAVDETVTLNVNAIVKRFADETYIPTIAVPLKATMAILLQRMGFQRDKASELIADAMTVALNEAKDATDEIADRCKDIDAAMDRVAALMESLPPKTRKGKTTIKGDMTEE